jgi:hypothetical protein
VSALTNGAVHHNVFALDFIKASTQIIHWNQD